MSQVRLWHKVILLTAQNTTNAWFAITGTNPNLVTFEDQMINLATDLFVESDELDVSVQYL